MNKSDSNKLSMYRATDAVLDLNVPKYPGHIMLNTLKTELDTSIEELIKKEKELQTVFAGKTSAKDKAKIAMIESLIPLSRNLFVFAKRNNKEDLKSIADVKKGMLVRMKENELEIRAKQIKDLLVENKTALADFSVTEEEITELGNKITLYAETSNEQDTGFTGRVSTNTGLDLMFANIDELLKEDLDSIMESFKEKDPAFYNAYKTARSIKDLGGHNKGKDDSQPDQPTSPTEPQK